MESLELAIASKRVREYSDQLSVGATEGLEIEKQKYELWLKSGMDAYRWLSRCDETFLEAVDQGLLERAEQAEEELATLYKAWLDRSAAAESATQRLLKLGQTLENLAEFRDCAAGVRDWLERYDWRERSRRSRSEEFLTESW